MQTSGHGLPPIAVTIKFKKPLGGLCIRCKLTETCQPRQPQDSASDVA